MRRTKYGIAALALAAALGAVGTAQAGAFDFIGGDLVVAVSGDGGNTGSYADNQASPLTLMQFTPTGSAAGALVLPQTQMGADAPISGEYGSSSEGFLQLSGNGADLTLMGYGVNANAYNADPQAYGVTSKIALGQTRSAAVPRVVALIGADGTVDTTTALTNVFNANNPRSAYTEDGSSFYVSGQGTKGDTTGGVFLAQRGATTATPITGVDATDKGSPDNQDTRDVQIVDGQLVVSANSTTGQPHSGAIGTIGTPGGSLPVTTQNALPTPLPGFTQDTTITLTAATATDANRSAIGSSVYISPEQFFFANADTMYVADGGNPKDGGLGDGGLQKWSLIDGSWVIDYTLSQGLGLVADTGADGVSGLFGLTGTVVGDSVDLYATSETLGDIDQSYLYSITDDLAAMTLPADESFATLAAAPADSNFRGVAFAPQDVPEPSSLALVGTGLLALGLLRRRRSRPA